MAKTQTLISLLLFAIFAGSVLADFNVTAVDDHAVGKRQYFFIVVYYNDPNMSGTSDGYTSPTSVNYPSTSPYYNKISSISVFPASFTYVYTGASYTGTCWAFATGTYADLGLLGINDQIKSAVIANNPFKPVGTNAGVILFKDYNYLGKSVVVGPGAYTTITSCAYNGCGSFDDNSLSSIHIFPRTVVYLYDGGIGQPPCGSYDNMDYSNTVKLNLPIGSCGDNTVSSLRVWDSGTL